VSRVYPSSRLTAMTAAYGQSIASSPGSLGVRMYRKTTHMPPTNGGVAVHCEVKKRTDGRFERFLR